MIKLKRYFLTLITLCMVSSLHGQKRSSFDCPTFDYSKASAKLATQFSREGKVASVAFQELKILYDEVMALLLVFLMKPEFPIKIGSGAFSASDYRSVIQENLDRFPVCMILLARHYKQAIKTVGFQVSPVYELLFGNLLIGVCGGNASRINFIKVQDSKYDLEAGDLVKAAVYIAGSSDGDEAKESATGQQACLNDVD